MNLANQIAELEAQHAQDQKEISKLKEQVERQRGGIMEGRAQNTQLIKRNEELAAQNARYDKHFRDALSSGESIIKHRTELQPAPPPPSAPEASNTILGKLSRLGLKTEVAA